MEIKTKFNIGDEVFFMLDNKVTKDIVENIEIGINMLLKTQKEVYFLKTNKELHPFIGKIACISGDKLFLTKEELLASL